METWGYRLDPSHGESILDSVKSTSTPCPLPFHSLASSVDRSVNSAVDVSHIFSLVGFAGLPVFVEDFLNGTLFGCGDNYRVPDF